HGRDIFAPVAAQLAAGLDFRKLGEEIYDFDTGRLPQSQHHGNEIRGEIVYVDRFGNLISNIPASELHENIRTKIGTSVIPGLSSCYSDGKAGEPIALAGSSGCLEVALNLGSASEQLKCSEGEKITVFI
ncbi:MAG: S-adenosyl-l-methionine hydroxide adenosyltransferase family protein, partial [bacterium]